MAEPPDEDIARVFARVFRGNDGEQARWFLRRMTLERVLPPSAMAEELRELEGQRRLVKLVENLIARGNSDD